MKLSTKYFVNDCRAPINREMSTTKRKGKRLVNCGENNKINKNRTVGSEHPELSTLEDKRNGPGNPKVNEEGVHGLFNLAKEDVKRIGLEKKKKEKKKKKLSRKKGKGRWNKEDSQGLADAQHLRKYCWQCGKFHGSACCARSPCP